MQSRRVEIENFHQINWVAVVPPEGGARDFTLDFLRELEKQLVNPLYVFDAKVEIENIKNDFNSIEDNQMWEVFDQRLVCFVLEAGAQVLYTGGLAPVSAYSLKLLKNAGVYSIHHFCEDFRQAKYYKEIAAFYDVILTLQKAPLVDEIEQLGAKAIYLPNATAELDFRSNPTHQISFVGIPTPWRIQCLELLQREGFDLNIAGSGWDKVDSSLSRCVSNGQWVGSIERQQVFSQSVLSLNLSVNESPQGDPYQQVSPRLFEIPLCGAVPISQYSPLLKDLIPEVPQFNSPSQLLELVRLLLNSPQRLALLQHLQSEIRKSHLFKHRVHTLLDSLNKH